MPGPSGRSPYPTRSSRRSISNTNNNTSAIGTAAAVAAAAPGSATGNANTSVNHHHPHSPRRRSSSSTSFHIPNSNHPNTSMTASSIYGSGWNAVREPNYHPPTHPHHPPNQRHAHLQHPPPQPPPPPPAQQQQQQQQQHQYGSSSLYSNQNPPSMDNLHFMSPTSPDPSSRNMSFASSVAMSSVESINATNNTMTNTTIPSSAAATTTTTATTTSTNPLNGSLGSLSITPQMGEEGYTPREREGMGRFSSSSPSSPSNTMGNKNSSGLGVSKHFTFSMNQHPLKSNNGKKKDEFKKDTTIQNDANNSMMENTTQNEKNTFSGNGGSNTHMNNKTQGGQTNNDSNSNTNKKPNHSTSSPINDFDKENNYIRLKAQKALDSHTATATATFYASILYTRTKSYHDAFLYAKALAANDESKRALLLLEQSGLLPFPRYNVPNQNLQSQPFPPPPPPPQPTTSNVIPEHELYNSNQNPLHNKYQSVSVKMYVEAALLASKCLCSNGDYEEAASLLEETCRYPPYTDNSSHNIQLMKQSNYQFPNAHHDPMTSNHDTHLIHQNNNNHLNHYSTSSVIEDGTDPHLFLLAKCIVKEKGEIHPLAQLACARGKIYNELSNPTKAAGWLQASLHLDPYCVEAFEYLFDRRLLSVKEEQKLVEELKWDQGEERIESSDSCADTDYNDDGNHYEKGGISENYWLKDYYRARVSVPMDHPFTNTTGEEEKQMLVKEDHKINMKRPAMGTQESRQVQSSEDDVHDMKPPPYQIQIRSPSLQLYKSASQSRWTSSTQYLFKTNTSNEIPYLPKSTSRRIPSTDTVPTNPLIRLQTIHNLTTSPLILALSAKQSYSSHHIRYALEQCRSCQAIDPLNPNIVFTHAAALYALSEKRELFHLAHVFVNANPREAIGWFTVGCYYMACQKYEIAQRHFCRATRLDPKCADAWIGFGCAFAAADESDQALASFRAAQRLYQGSHIPILYMGMEYLRTNHLSLAGHFLGSAGRMNTVDPLSFNELGVCAYRAGNFEEAAGLFAHSLRLSVRLELLGRNMMTKRSNTQKHIVQTKMLRLREMAGLRESSTSGRVHVGDDVEIVQNTALQVEHLTDSECILACADTFWEPTVFNLGQCYRKIRRFDDAARCFEKAISLCPGNAASYAALGFTKHLIGDIDDAIESYHQALSMKPDDTFSGEMLNRALHEAFTKPDPLFDTDSTHNDSRVSNSHHKMRESFASNKSSVYDLDSDAEHYEDTKRQSIASMTTKASSNLSLDCSEVDMSLT